MSIFVTITKSNIFFLEQNTVEEGKTTAIISYIIMDTIRELKVEFKKNLNINGRM